MSKRPCWRRAALIGLILLLTCCGIGHCSCQRGFPRSKVRASVTPQVTKGQAVLTVQFHDCGSRRNIWLSTSDKSFEVHHDGSITATQSQNIGANCEFKVWAIDLDTGETWTMDVLLMSSRRTELVKRRVQVIQFPTKRVSLRQKREWITPPIDIREHEPPINNPIAIIISDLEDVPGIEITYSLTGPGADRPPKGLFVIDPYTGELNITGTVDREENDHFILTGHAMDQFGRSQENPIALFIKVLDINDNPPIFTQEIFEGSVEELSSLGTFVIRVNATDKDTKENGMISYRVVTESMKEMFAASMDGAIRVTNPHLDRETQDGYTLLVEARDMAGNIQGMHTTATVQIKILDVNDNIPTIKQTKYEITVEENMKYFNALHLKVEDGDLEFTDNWLGHFEIIEGNEHGHFRIEVNNQTNEGILIVQKELNFEEMEQVHLVVRLSNKAAYHHTVHTSNIMQPIDIKVIVKNMPDGFAFKPSKLVTKIVESTTTKRIRKVIGIYPAVSADTGEPSKTTIYAKDSDVANWLTINSETGEITFDGVIDRESEYVVNGTYKATVLAISNERGSLVTCTGTIVVEVQDVNDHIPTFDNTQPCMCSHAKYLNITASDPDGPPFGTPFRFKVQSDKMWKLGRTDATSMELVPSQDLWPGVFSVPVWIEDSDGKGHTVKLEVKVADCHSAIYCSSEKLIQSKAVLGSSAVVLMILPLLLLLVLPLLLLLFCQCGGGSGRKTGFMLAEKDGGQGVLGQSNFEGGGQVDTMIPLVNRPGQLKAVATVHEGLVGGAEATGSAKSSFADMKQTITERTVRTVTKGAGIDVGHSMSIHGGHGRSSWKHGQYQTWRDDFGMVTGARKAYMEQYINQKLLATAQECNSESSRNCLLVYNNEGSNSPVGSLDCCSFIEDDPFDYSFLNDLDPKFKMLAEICSGQSMGERSEVTSATWELKASPQPLIQQKEVAKEEIVSSNVTKHQHNVVNPSSLKQHYIVTTTVQPSREEFPVVNDQSSMMLHREDFQNVSFTTDPTMAQTVTKVDYSTGEFQGTVPSFTSAPAVQKNIVVTRSVSTSLGGIQSMAADPPIGKGPLMQETVVATSSVNTGSRELQDILAEPLISHVPVTQENSFVTGSVNAGLRETLDHSSINRQAIEKNVTTNISNRGMYNSVKKTTKLVQLVQE